MENEAVSRGQWVPGRHLERLREEADLMEKRLESFGFDGDCAYEKALVRYYERELDLRRALLDEEERL